MNKVYIVSYDLNKPGQDYVDLINELKKSESWWYYLDSTWLIYTHETANSLYNRIAPFLDTNDYVLVIDVAKDYQGWLSQKAWDWIHKYI